MGFADVVVCVRYDVDSEPCQCSPGAQERSGVEEFPVPLEIRERQRTSSGRKIHVLEGVAGLC